MTNMYNTCVRILYYLLYHQMTDGKGSIHDAVRGAGSDSDHMVIILDPHPHDEQLKHAKILYLVLFFLLL